MIRHEDAKREAFRHLRIADHMLSVTYPLINDPKLLKVILKNVYLSVEHGCAMLLAYDRNASHHDMSGMLPHMPRLFRKYNISKGYLSFLNDLSNVMQNHRESDIEFIRKEKFVFASQDYDLNIVSTGEIKDFMVKAKLFLQQLNGVIENDRIA